MTVGTPSGQALEPTTEVLRILEGYLRQLEQGGQPDPDALLAQHPHLAEPLRACLASLEFLHDAALSLRGGGARPALPQAVSPPAAQGTLGDFRIVREVGRGGMGVVYEAVQESLGRRVALKVLPFAATLDARQLQRFKNEAHTAAGLHHSHIVPVYAVGCERGIHYYAMQFIDGSTLAALIAGLRQEAGLEPPGGEPPGGEPPGSPRRSGRPQTAGIKPAARPAAGPEGDGPPATEPCLPPGTRGPGADTPGPGLGLLSTAGSVRSRAFFAASARLGIAAAEALEHAHGLGVIHRDVKPANLLLDGRGELWVTDFGLAVAQGDGRLTLSGDLVGTLRYMSPEQALARPGGVDARSDVYSLGVTLYELLTLQPAFAGGDRQELLRQIAFDEPRPPRRLNRAVPAELETVVLKAMAKAPEERYASAGELGDDLRRWLEDRPIKARRPTLWQCSRKWARRHWPAVVTAGLCAVLLLVAAVGWLWREMRLAEARAAQATAATEEISRALGKAEFEREQARRARAAEAVERKQAEAVARLLESVFQGVDPRWGGQDLRGQLLRRLDEVATDLETKYPGQSLVRARLRNALGLTQHSLGEYRKARAQFEQALVDCRPYVSLDHPGVLNIRNNLALAYEYTGEVDRAVALFKRVLRKRQARFGPDHPDTLTTMNNLAEACVAAGQPGEAVALLQQVLAREKVRLGPDHPRTLTILANLGTAYVAAGQAARAVPLLRRALQRRRATLGPDHPDTLQSMNNLAGAHEGAGELARALPLFEQTLQKRKAVLGPDHPETLTTMNNLANAYRADGRLDEALALFEQTLKRQTARLGPDHPGTLKTLNNLALSHKAAGRPDRAVLLYEQALAKGEARQGPDHPDTCTIRANLAEAYEAAGRPERAVPLRRRALAQKTAALGPDHPDTLTALNSLAKACYGAGEIDRAVPLLEQALKKRRARLGPDHLDTLQSLNNLAAAYWGAGEAEKAVPLFEWTLAKRQARLGPDHPDTLTSINNLASAYRSAGQMDEAVRLFEQLLHRRRARHGDKHPDTQSARRAVELSRSLKPGADRYAQALAAKGAEHADTLQARLHWALALRDQASEPAAAEHHLRALHETSRRKLGAAHAATLAVQLQLGMTFLSQKKFAEAEPHLRAFLSSAEKKQPDEWMTFLVKSVLGYSLLGQKKYAEAEPFLLQGYEGLKQRQARMPAPTRASVVAEALGRLVLLYDAWGKKDRADQWRKERQALQEAERKPQSAKEK
jgi:serine/threonine protein kinase